MGEFELEKLSKEELDKGFDDLIRKLNLVQDRYSNKGGKMNNLGISHARVEATKLLSLLKVAALLV